jgi:sodium/bile acid cotransporter 7
MLANISKNWFLIALAICFTVGYVAADYLRPLLDVPFLRSGIVFTVMWMMGVTLQANTIQRSFMRPLPSILAIGTNIAVVPLLCLPTRLMLPEPFFGGLFIAAIVPCTLASASVWTRKAGGDDSIAMMTTVVTNLACFIVVPVGILLVLSQQMDIDVGGQIGKLSLLVVAPLILAQIMRRLGCADWADRNKTRLSAFSQVGILSMVVFGAIAGAQFVDGVAEEDSTLMSPASIGVLVFIAATIHMAALGFGIGMARVLGIDRARQIAIGIAGSQKTLMVGLQIAIDLGVSVVPMLVYHLLQLFIDTIIAQRWKQGNESQELA